MRQWAAKELLVTYTDVKLQKLLKIGANVMVPAGPSLRVATSAISKRTLAARVQLRSIPAALPSLLAPVKMPMMVSGKLFGYWLKWPERSCQSWLRLTNLKPQTVKQWQNGICGDLDHWKNEKSDEGVKIFPVEVSNYEADLGSRLLVTRVDGEWPIEKDSCQFLHQTWFFGNCQVLPGDRWMCDCA